MQPKFIITHATSERLNKFRDDRDWKKHHTPGELARALHIEAGELSELFLWKPGSAHVSTSKLNKEIADISIYLFYLCQAYDIDMDSVINNAIDENERNYPISNGDRPDRDK